MGNESEDFTDTGNGIPDLAEPFIDTPNGEWDPGEVLYDMNQKIIGGSADLSCSDFSNLEIYLLAF